MDVARGSVEPGTSSTRAAVRYVAAALAFAVLAIHLWIVPETFVATLLPGLFFLLVGMGQGLLGVSLLFGPGRWALRLGIALNLLVVAVWGISRIVSLPEVTGIAQPSVGLLDATATVLETILVIALLRLRDELG